MNENELIKQAKKLNVKSFETLIKKYELKIYHSAYWFIGNKDDAMDLVQEVFIDAFKKIKSFRQECAFLTWLNWILLDRVSRKRRKQKTLNKYIYYLEEDDREYTKEYVSHVDKNPVNILIDQEEQNKILGAINVLEDKYRMPIVLCDLEHLSYKEAAETLRYNESTLKTRLFRARVKLRDLLNKVPK
ncbi:MAG: RNA polymerase sigma factor [bacterium]|nr:RNA polymerase sigma factor [bacterium]